MRRRLFILISVFVVSACSSSATSSDLTTIGPTTSTTAAIATGVPASPARSVDPSPSSGCLSVEIGSYGNGKFVDTGPIPGDFVADLAPPAATCARVVTDPSDPKKRRFALFVDATPVADQLRHYAKVIQAHGGSISSVYYLDDDTYQVTAYAPDLTMEISIGKGLVGVEMDLAAQPDSVGAEDPYPKRLPKALLPEDRLSMHVEEFGDVATDDSVDITTLVPLKTVVDAEIAALKKLGATDIEVIDWHGKQITARLAGMNMLIKADNPGGMVTWISIMRSLR